MNLGMIRVTCPHLLGLAHNCDDLFLLSKPRGMPPAAPLHLAPLLFFFLSLINILFVFAFWLQCSPSALTNCVEACVGVHMCVCIRDMHFSLCVCVCVLVNGPACICAAFWPQQPINTAVCWTVRCAWPPAMATRPKDSHRSVLRRGLVHCLKVTGLVDGAVRDANGCPARPGLL